MPMRWPTARLLTLEPTAITLPTVYRTEDRHNVSRTVGMRSVSGGPHLMACHLSRGPQVHQVGGAHTTCENLGKNIELSQLGGNTLSRNEHLRHMDVTRAEIAKR